MKSIVETIGKLFKNKGFKLVTAESCTGGLIIDRLTDVSGASLYIDRGFVTYSNESKMEVLGVSEETLKEFGAVSKETALEMAQGALEASLANVSLSVTGIAGPLGGTEDKPVGTVHIAIDGPYGILHEECFYPVERREFKEEVATKALYMLEGYLEGETT